MAHRIPDHRGYPASHCWYYYLGGRIPTPKDIRSHVAATGYRGYLADSIELAARKSEPQRGQALRRLSASIKADLKQDFAKYRHYAFQLRAHRLAGLDDTDEPACADIHIALSLKFAHIYNGFANLSALENIETKQLDLFGLL